MRKLLLLALIPLILFCLGCVDKSPPEVFNISYERGDTTFIIMWETDYPCSHYATLCDDVEGWCEWKESTKECGTSHYLELLNLVPNRSYKLTLFNDHCGRVTSTEIEIPIGPLRGDG